MGGCFCWWFSLGWWLSHKNTWGWWRFTNKMFWGVTIPVILWCNEACSFIGMITWDLGLNDGKNDESTTNHLGWKPREFHRCSFTLYWRKIEIVHQTLWFFKYVRKIENAFFMITYDLAQSIIVPPLLVPDSANSANAFLLFWAGVRSPMFDEISLLVKLLTSMTHPEGWITILGESPIFVGYLLVVKHGNAKHLEIP